MEAHAPKRKVKEEEDDEAEEEEKDDEDLSKLVLGIMEGYSDSVIPPLSLFRPAIDVVDSSSKKRTVFENVKERDRRLKMNENFSLLESIVPGLLPKSTKEKVIQRTIEYIKYLEDRKTILGNLRDSSLQNQILCTPSTTTHDSASSSLSITVCGRVGFFGIRCPKRQGLVAQILTVFQRHEAEVLAANVAVNEGQLGLTVTAIVSGEAAIEMIRREILIL